MRVAAYRLLATASDPLLDYFYGRFGHDQSAYSMKPEGVHSATFQTEFSE